MPAPVRVILSTYEQAPRLRLALRGYLRQTTNAFAMSIADDGSGPATRALVEAFAVEAARRGIPVDHVWQEDSGFRKARVVNESVRRAGDEGLLVFTDGDCVPPSYFVERHLAAHEPRSFHVGGVVLLSKEVSEGLDEGGIDAGRHEGLTSAAHRQDLARRARKTRWGTWLRRKNRPKVFGANMAFDRALFEAVNGFDERFEGYGFEDDDLRDRVMRLRPRPRVKNLYTRNDVFHLWHHRPADLREQNRAYHRTAKPVRCEVGLVGGGLVLIPEDLEPRVP